MPKSASPVTIIAAFTAVALAAGAVVLPKDTSGPMTFKSSMVIPSLSCASDFGSANVGYYDDGLYSYTLNGPSGDLLQRSSGVRTRDSVAYIAQLFCDSGRYDTRLIEEFQEMTFMNFLLPRYSCVGQDGYKADVTTDFFGATMAITNNVPGPIKMGSYEFAQQQAYLYCLTYALG